MNEERLAQIEAAHAEHCQYKCCGNGSFSHHPEEGEEMCPSVELTAAVRTLWIEVASAQIETAIVAKQGVADRERADRLAAENAVLQALARTERTDDERPR